MACDHSEHGHCSKVNESLISNDEVPTIWLGGLDRMVTPELLREEIKRMFSERVVEISGVDIPTAKRYTKAGRKHGGFAFVQFSGVEKRDAAMVSMNSVFADKARLHPSLQDLQAKCSVYTIKDESRIQTSRYVGSKDSSDTVLPSKPTESKTGPAFTTETVTTCQGKTEEKKAQKRANERARRMRRMKEKLHRCEAVINQIQTSASASETGFLSDSAFGASGLRTFCMKSIPLGKLLHVIGTEAGPNFEVDWQAMPPEFDPEFDMMLGGRKGRKPNPKRLRRQDAEISRAQRKRWQIECFSKILHQLRVPDGETVIDFGNCLCFSIGFPLLIKRVREV